jgi:hypothetical protein
MINIWREIAGRIEQNLEIQPQDRLRGIRMLGNQPVDCMLDQRVWLIYSASFGLHPAEKEHAFEDLKSDMGKVELEAFVDRVQSRWPLQLDSSDTPKCKQALLDLIARNVERLEAKREAHLEHADESAVSAAARLAYEESPQGERLARYELASQRRVHRCRDAFWKHRREMEKDGGRRVEDGGEAFEGRDEDGGRRAADGGEADNVADLRVAAEASGGPIKNLTSEPGDCVAASEAGSLQEVAVASAELKSAFSLLLGHLGRGSVPFGMPVDGGAKGLAAIEEAILAGKPLLKT